MVKSYANDCIVYRSVKPDEKDHVAELVSNAFVPQFLEFKKFVTTTRNSDPTFEPKNIRLLEIDNKVVSHVQILPRKIQVGNIALECAGVGCVATPTQYRGKGYNKLLMEHCLSFMANEGYDISLLDGINNYYTQFGYAKVMSKYYWDIDMTAGDCVNNSHKIRKATKDDCETLNDLYSTDVRGLTGFVVRSIPMWWPYLMKRYGDLLLFMNENQRVEGYLWLDKNKYPFVNEACVSNPSVCESILSYLASKRRQYHERNIIGTSHPEQRFIRYVMEKFGGRIEIKSEKSGGWMGRICNLDGLFKKLLPELRHKLQQSELAFFKGIITFSTDIGDINLEIENADIQITSKKGTSNSRVVLSQNRLVQLIFGYMDIKELKFIDAIKIHKSQNRLVEVFFPKQTPAMSRIDWF